MKKIFALPLAVLLVAACSESTAPSATADLTPRYAKPGSGGGFTEICTSSCLVSASYDFEAGLDATGTGTTLGTGVKVGTSGTADVPTVVTAPSNQHFVGRFENVNTELLLNVTNGHTTYSLTFDLYTIGSWDGKGKQAQQGIFKANVFSIEYRCYEGTTLVSTGTTFASTFSNQLTVQQDYPNAFGLGGYKAATGSYNTDLLGYRNDPTSNTPLFRSFGDVEYKLHYSGANPCGAGNAVQFVFTTTAPAQQSVFDESWGIDNIIIKAI